MPARLAVPWHSFCGICKHISVDGVFIENIYAMPDNNSNGLARQLKGNLFILIATIFFGVNLPVVKVLIPHWMTSMDVSAVRNSIGAI